MIKLGQHIFGRKTVLMTYSIVIMALLVCHSRLAAQESQTTPIRTPAATKSPTQDIHLKESLEKTLVAEQQNYQQLAEQLQQILFFGKDIEAEVNTYKIEISAYNNLLLLSTTSTEELGKVHGNSKSALDHISARLKELQQQSATFEQLRLKTEEQYALNDKQLDEIKADGIQQTIAETEITALLEQLKSLTGLLDEKREMLANILVVYTGLISKLQEIQQGFVELSEQFTRQIEERKTRELFERKSNPLSAFGWSQITIEFAQFSEHIRLALSIRFWFDTSLWQTERFLFIRLFLYFAMTILLLLRLRRFFIGFIHKIPCDRYPWRCVMLRMAQKSLFLSGITAFSYVYEQIRPLHSVAPAAQVSMQIFMILLFTQWLLGFFKYWGQIRGEAKPNRLLFHIRIVIVFIRYFSIVYVVVLWALGNSSVLLLFARLLFEIALIVWSIPFWRIFRETPQQVFPGSPETRNTLRSATVGLGYIIAFTGLLLELSGYGLLAQYWFFSWGKTFIVFLWGLLLFAVLREWEQGAKEQESSDQEQPFKKARYSGWFLVRLCWIISPVFLIAGILVAWGAKQYILVGVLELLRYPITIGGVNVQFLGVMYAIVILLLTDVANRLWRRVFREKIFVNSGLAIGFQESITTMSSYVIWLIGILWALRSIGIGTTSLAVVFGALGIGLGFGLQGIFNNFVSGLILLFERPIEVGNIIEVNGTWGCVEKINVRATVVRTYDNSALIIPNSDIVSNHLTNWTFRDARMRRTIQIGVAYGSDVKLVEQTLYEIAQNHPRVMVDPAPMVLFSDFGDSALIFKLRVWTLIDYGLISETELRFDIDRIFREKELTIAFPQLDIHVHPEGHAGQPHTENSVFS